MLPVFSRPDPDMNWKALDFEQITARELYLILRARSAVFVVEQSCVHLDPDGRDETSVHVFAAEDISRSMPVIAYARLHEGGTGAAEVVVDKILTSPQRRCDGTAHVLIERVIAAAGERWPGRSIRLLAPVSLRGFYEAFGFRKNDGPFDDRGVHTISLVRKSRLNLGLARTAGCIDTVETF
ncbi:ElaA protein [Caballeronia sordidicola]|uniref:ElaA protein n=2 Tax=Burkholderiales TaxID=80840 RepID=A0A242MLR3_CABSO|nr:ElaA protein [Caballeronia sordidicola]